MPLVCQAVCIFTVCKRAASSKRKNSYYSGDGQLQLTSGFTTLTTFEINYRVRSIAFAAGWHVRSAARKSVI
jgi:hypothetical protein